MQVFQIVSKGSQRVGPGGVFKFGPIMDPEHSLDAVNLRTLIAYGGGNRFNFDVQVGYNGVYSVNGGLYENNGSDVLENSASSIAVDLTDLSTGLFSFLLDRYSCTDDIEVSVNDPSGILDGFGSSFVFENGDRSYIAALFDIDPSISNGTHIVQFIATGCDYSQTRELTFVVSGASGSGSGSGSGSVSDDNPIIIPTASYAAGYHEIEHGRDTSPEDVQIIDSDGWPVGSVAWRELPSDPTNKIQIYTGGGLTDVTIKIFFP